MYNESKRIPILNLELFINFISFALIKTNKILHPPYCCIYNSQRNAIYLHMFMYPAYIYMSSKIQHTLPKK